ncbi:MAG: hypothetical protein DMG05_14485 [Acidobacteria bacterium]|nr:MAG: hypothetical protein DMG05_14485 [Acidobacteriota bacterium]
MCYLSLAPVGKGGQGRFAGSIFSQPPFIKGDFDVTLPASILVPVDTLQNRSIYFFFLTVPEKERLS